MKNLNTNIIDYQLLYHAIKYFGKKGFIQVETPWRVSKTAMDSTFKSEEAFATDNKFLVGSAEQGFLEMKLHNKIGYGTFMSVSPCFRNEDSDYYHQQEFMKLELIHFSDHPIDKDASIYSIFRQMVVNFLIKELKVKPGEIAIVGTNDTNSIYSEDITIHGIEYGSYGIRVFNNTYYMYGTGIALPRASKILK